MSPKVPKNQDNHLGIRKNTFLVSSGALRVRPASLQIGSPPGAPPQDHEDDHKLSSPRRQLKRFCLLGRLETRSSHCTGKKDPQLKEKLLCFTALLFNESLFPQGLSRRFAQRTNRCTHAVTRTSPNRNLIDETFSPLETKTPHRGRTKKNPDRPKPERKENLMGGFKPSPIC